MYPVPGMVKQLYREEALVQTAASRAEDVNWIMGPEGMRAFRRQIPRWEAEQLVIAEGALRDRPTASEQWRERQTDRQRRLAKELHGKGAVGQAFQELCKAGCDGKWLEQQLFFLAEHAPLGRSRKECSFKEKQLVARAASNLDSAAADLDKVLDNIPTLLLDSTVKEWPVPVQRTQVVLRGIAYCLRKSMTDSHLVNRRSLTATLRLPWLLSEIKRFTSDHRPHYAHMAAVIGAAYGKPNFSKDSLKTLVSRSRF